VDAVLALGDLATFVPGHGGVTGRGFVHAQQLVLAQVVSAARELAAGPVPDDAWQLTGLPEPTGRIALSRCLAQLRGELR
jgi:hypothetical protein